MYKVSKLVPLERPRGANADALLVLAVRDMRATEPLVDIVERDCGEDTTFSPEGS